MWLSKRTIHGHYLSHLKKLLDGGPMGYLERNRLCFDGFDMAMRQNPGTLLFDPE